jgi:hypothetical protein
MSAPLLVIFLAFGVAAAVRALASQSVERDAVIWVLLAGAAVVAALMGTE